MEIYAVIMAGGVGSRFWPRSKEKTPKQLISMFGENTMIQDTVARMEGLVDPKNVFVITNKVQKPRVLVQLPQLPVENIIDEPSGKNTAACIGLASILIKAKKEDAVVVTLPSDHLIKDDEAFRTCLKNAAEFAYSSRGLVTIGITPSRPETGYGYIQFDEEEIKPNIHKVLTFAEKPNLSTAIQFVEAGDFLWNAGIFIWRVDVILEEIKEHLPDLYEGLEMIEPAIGKEEFHKELLKVYGQLRSISIDYGVMEKSNRVFLTKADFYWNDLGSWEAVYEVAEKNNEGNSLTGEIYTAETFNSYIHSPKKFVATIGVEDLIIIDTEESLIICNRKNAREVRQVVEYLKMNKKTNLI